MTLQGFSLHHPHQPSSPSRSVTQPTSFEDLWWMPEPKSGGTGWDVSHIVCLGKADRRNSSKIFKNHQKCYIVRYGKGTQKVRTIVWKFTPLLRKKTPLIRVTHSVRVRYGFGTYFIRTKYVPFKPDQKWLKNPSCSISSPLKSSLSPTKREQVR